MDNIGRSWLALYAGFPCSLFLVSRYFKADSNLMSRPRYTINLILSCFNVIRSTLLGHPQEFWEFIRYPLIILKIANISTSLDKGAMHPTLVHLILGVLSNLQPHHLLLRPGQPLPTPTRFIHLPR